MPHAYLNYVLSQINDVPCKAGAKVNITSTDSGSIMVACPAAGLCKYSSCGSTCGTLDVEYICQVTGASSQCMCDHMDVTRE